MKRLTTLFIALLCIQTFVQAMEPQKELDLKWTFACVSHLRNANPTDLQITGISPLEVHIRPSQAHKTQLQQAFLGSLEAVTMQDGVSLDMTKLIAFADIIKTVQAEHEQQEKEAIEAKKKQKEVPDLGFLTSI